MCACECVCVHVNEVFTGTRKGPMIPGARVESSCESPCRSLGPLQEQQVLLATEHLSASL